MSIFGEFNSCNLNTLPVNAGYLIITDNPLELVLELLQLIGNNVNSLLILSLSQDVQFQNVFAGQIIQVAQDVECLFEGLVIKV